MIIKRSFGSYNERRYGKPWGAKITFPDSIKPKYDFDGYWDGSHVLINADIGDVVAFGQRDHRGNGTKKSLFIVEPDGELTQVSEANAREHSVKVN